MLMVRDGKTFGYTYTYVGLYYIAIIEDVLQ